MNQRLMSLQGCVRKANFLVGLTWGWGTLAYVPGDVEGILLAADKPARLRLWMAIWGWTYVGVGAWHLVRPGANRAELGCLALHGCFLF